MNLVVTLFMTLFMTASGSVHMRGCSAQYQQQAPPFGGPSVGHSFFQHEDNHLASVRLAS